MSNDSAVAAILRFAHHIVMPAHILLYLNRLQSFVFTSFGHNIHIDIRIRYLYSSASIAGLVRPILGLIRYRVEYIFYWRSR